MAGQTLATARNNPPTPGEASEPAACLRVAVLDALKTDGALAALLGADRVLDEAPEPIVFPHVTVGDVSPIQQGEYQLAVHGFAKEYRLAHVISGAVLNSLDEMPLRLDGFRVAGLCFAVADVVRETIHGAVVWHAFVRFRAVVEVA